MFVVYESSILNLIGIVYLKVINVRFYFISKKSYFLSMFAQKWPRRQKLGRKSDTEHRLRSPTPTPNPRPINWVIRAAPNNSSLIQPAPCAKANRQLVTPGRQPNNCSETGLAGRAKNWDICQQTNNSSVRARPDQPGGGLLPGTRANNRRVLRLFLADQLAGPGNRERTIIRFSTRLVKKRTKKTRARSSGFFRTILLSM